MYFHPSGVLLPILTQLAGWHCRNPLVVSDVLDLSFPVQGVPRVTFNGDEIPHGVGRFLSSCHSPITYDWCGTRTFRLTWKEKGRKKKIKDTLLLHQIFKTCQFAPDFSSFTHRHSPVKHPRNSVLDRSLSPLQSHQGRSSHGCTWSGQTLLFHRQICLESGTHWGSSGQDMYLQELTQELKTGLVRIKFIS